MKTVVHDQDNPRPAHNVTRDAMVSPSERNVTRRTGDAECGVRPREAAPAGPAPDLLRHDSASDLLPRGSSQRLPPPQDPISDFPHGAPASDLLPARPASDVLPQGPASTRYSRPPPDQGN
jgi:hypothetical protein